MASKRKLVDQIWQDMKNELESRGSSWVPSRQRILTIPKILPCETFSSWVYRSFLASGVPLRELMALWQIQSSPFWVDIGVVGFDPELIASTFLNPDVAAIKKSIWAQYSPLASWQGLCLSCDPIRRAPIYRYCKECLRADPIPYIRKAWRLAYTYICSEHGLLLRATCPNCHVCLDLSGKAKFLHGIRSKRLTLRNCQHCGADLCCGRNSKVKNNLLDILLGAQLKMQSMVNDAVPRVDLDTHDAWDALPPISAENLVLLISRFPQFRQPMNPRLRYQGVDDLIVKASRDSKCRSDFLYAGIHGRWLFGKHSYLIQQLLAKHQQTFESTHWLPNDDTFLRLNSCQILGARKWLIGEMRKCGALDS